MTETRIMEEISKNPHPSIIKYHGCRVNRGRITALLLEPLEQTLAQLAETPAFKNLDTAALVDAIGSAASYLHDTGLAHNDISPHNIMFRKDGEPALIDFGSCARFGERLQSLGTAGWYEELFFTSEKKHDEYSIRRLREWLVERGEEGSSALPN